MSSESKHPTEGGTSREYGHVEPPATSTKRVGLVLLIVAIVAVVLAVTGILPRIHAEKKLVTDTNDAAIPQVLVIQPKQGAPAQEIVLPGNMQAYRDAPIYARTSGYLRKWYV